MASQERKFGLNTESIKKKTYYEQKPGGKHMINVGFVKKSLTFS